ncbi:MAG: response regulator [Cardiobacteriaceae bacterium]|nr:response regulator [Cardiobacteriaceae bacterium]
MYQLMVVDDSIIIRNKIARSPALQGKFNVVCRAKNGLEAIKMFRQYQPDVVTMDLNMPMMNGVECIQNLIKINPKIEILVVSAISDKETGIKALEYGANGFLTKPFSDQALLKALTELMENSSDY